MAERQQAGVAEQQIEAEQRDGVAEERDQQVGVERRRQDRHQAQRHDAGGNQKESVRPRITSPAFRTARTA